MSNARFTQSVAEQVAAHDAQIAALATNLTTLANTVDKGFKSLGDDFSKLIEARQTNWGTIAAWCAIIITLGGGLFLYIDKSREKDQVEMRLNNEHNKEIRTILFGHVNGRLDGHDAVTGSNSNRIATLESRTSQNTADSEGRYNAINGRVDSLKAVVADLFEEVKKRPLPVIADPERGPKHTNDAITPQR